MHARRGSRLVSLASALALALAPSRASAVDAARSFDQYATRTWTQAEGLPQNSVLAIAQTPEGYLWLGTEGGLVRFDGVKLTTFDRRRQPKLQSANVLALGVDGAGTLWIGTTAGLHRLVGETIEPVPLAPGAARNPGVACIAFSGDDVLVGTDAGFFRVRGGVGQRLTLPGLADQQIDAVLVAGGKVLLGTPNGLFAVDGDDVRDITAQVRLPFREVRALAALRDGTIVVGGRGRVAKLGTQVVLSSEADGLPREPVISFLEGEHGALWVGTDGGGLARITGTRVERITTKDGLTEDHVRALFDDRRGGLWIGTTGGGLQRAVAGPAVTFGVLHGLSMVDVRSVFGTRAGDLLVGTEGGGFFRREGASFVEGPKSPGRTVYGFAESGKGIFAFTREAGLLALGADGASASTVPGTESFRVRSAVFDAAGEPEWLGTHGHGVVRRAPDGAFKTVAPEVVSPGLIVFFVQRDGDGVIVGTRAGLYRVSDGKAERVPLPIPNDASVLHRRVEANGDTWFGTSAGVVWKHGDRFTVVDDRTGLVDEQVYATVESPAGTIWAATNRGVVRLAKRDVVAFAEGKSAAVPARVFGPADGFRTLESNAGDPSVFVDAFGAVWFGTTAGLTRLDPAKVTLSSDAPVPHLESVELDRASLEPWRAVRFTSGRHDLELGFTAFDYAAPAAITFAHQLEGLDQGWIEDGLRREASYTDLRPGRYRFRIRACSIDGACAESAAPLAITVDPRWFERRAVWGVFAGAIALTAWLAARARIRALHRRARELEDRVEERTVELRKALSEVQAKDHLLLQDIEEAARFQAIALRVQIDAADVRVGFRSMPAALVGGDLVDVFEFADGHYRFFIADTTGHGVQAALRTMVLKTEYEAMKWQHEWPHALLGAINDVLVANFPDLELRCTAACFDLVRVGSGGWELRFANAAAPEIFLRTGHDLAEIYQPGPFLGMMMGATFTMKRQVLPLGSRLVVFTDGLFEQEGAQGSFGHERIEEIVRATEGTAQDLADTLGDTVKAYAIGDELADDTTVLVIDLGGAAER
jgi:ligand-binding sensor domain-containing protein/serine phosphatase RsbU (regulator of sigma subunit)